MTEPKPRQWLHDLEHEAAALALWQERARFGRVSAKEKTEIRTWAADFKKRLAAFAQP